MATYCATGEERIARYVDMKHCNEAVIFRHVATTFAKNTLILMSIVINIIRRTSNNPFRNIKYVQLFHTSIFIQFKS